MSRRVIMAELPLRTSARLITSPARKPSKSVYQPPKDVWMWRCLALPMGGRGHGCWEAMIVPRASRSPPLTQEQCEFNGFR